MPIARRTGRRWLTGGKGLAPANLRLRQVGIGTGVGHGIGQRRRRIMGGVRGSALSVGGGVGVGGGGWIGRVHLRRVLNGGTIEAVGGHRLTELGRGPPIGIDGDLLSKLVRRLTGPGAEFGNGDADEATLARGVGIVGITRAAHDGLKGRSRRDRRLRRRGGRRRCFGRFEFSCWDSGV